MKKSILVGHSFLHALGVLIYISGVAWLMSNASRLFGKANDITAGIAVLMLLVFSATVTGLLVLGRPGYMYMEGRKMEAVKFFFATLVWLLVLLAAVFVYLATRPPLLP